MAKSPSMTDYEEATQRAREHVDEASRKPFFGWARKPKRNKYGDPVQNNLESSQKTTSEQKQEVKSLADLLPTKEQLNSRPFDASPPASEPE